MNLVAVLSGLLIKTLIENHTLRATVAAAAAGQQIVNPIVDQVLGAGIGAVLMRPQLLIISPLRFVGRIVGWPLGWGPIPNPHNYNAFEHIPHFHKFSMTCGNERMVLRLLAPNHVPNNVNIENVHLFIISHEGYTAIICVLAVMGSIIIAYVTYRVLRYSYFKVRRDLRLAASNEEETHKRSIKDRMKRLEAERKRIGKMAR